MGEMRDSRRQRSTGNYEGNESHLQIFSPRYPGNNEVSCYIK